MLWFRNRWGLGDPVGCQSSRHWKATFGTWPMFYTTVFDCSLPLQGTLPFISRRLLKAWHDHEDTTHTIIDDLESYVWVLLWTVLQKIRECNAATSEDNDLLRDLCCENVRALRQKKDSIIKDFRVYAKSKKTPTPGLAPFYIRFHELFRLCDQFEGIALTSLDEKPDASANADFRVETVKGYFVEYFTVLKSLCDDLLSYDGWSYLKPVVLDE